MTDTLHSDDIPHIPLDPSTEQVERWGRAAIAWMADYLASLRQRRVYPATTAREIRERLDARLPEAGADFEPLLAVMREVVVPFSRHNGHPRMFGYVQGPGTPIAALADLLASALNA